MPLNDMHNPVGFIPVARDGVTAPSEPKPAIKPLKMVVARMTAASEDPYKGWGCRFPTVVRSNHPQFQKGAHLIWGSIVDMLDDGYVVELLP